jgi:alpha-L-fucosidase
MRRRRFFHLLGGFAATPFVKSVAGLAQVEVQSEKSASTYPDGFNKFTEAYSHFCATPESERVFYALRDGRIISERLNNEDYKAAGYDPPQPELSMPGGSHAGVPMISPIADLAGDGPYKPTWESLLPYECPEWYRDAKFGIWNHWSPQCVPEDGDWYARNMYEQGSRQNKFHLAHYGSPLASATKTFVRNGRFSIGNRPNSWICM